MNCPHNSHDACETARNAAAAGARFCPNCGEALCTPSNGAAAGAPAVTSAPQESTPCPEAEADQAALFEPAAADAPTRVQHHSSAEPDNAPAPTAPHVSNADMRLILRTGEAEELMIPLGEKVVIGKRSDCDAVVADDPYVSRQHAQVIRRDGRTFVEDLGSSNGTLVKVARPLELEPGDEIVVGTTVIRLEGGCA